MTTFPKCNSGKAILVNNLGAWYAPTLQPIPGTWQPVSCLGRSSCLKWAHSPALAGFLSFLVPFSSWLDCPRVILIVYWSVPLVAFSHSWLDSVSVFCRHSRDLELSCSVLFRRYFRFLNLIQSAFFCYQTVSFLRRLHPYPGHYSAHASVPTGLLSDYMELAPS